MCSHGGWMQPQGGFSPNSVAIHAANTRPFAVRWNHFWLLLSADYRLLSWNRWHQVRQFIVCVTYWFEVVPLPSGTIPEIICFLKYEKIGFTAIEINSEWFPGIFIESLANRTTFSCSQKPFNFRTYKFDMLLSKLQVLYIFWTIHFKLEWTIRFL